MQRCCHCHGRFGLVSHRYLFKRFCSRACVSGHKRRLAAATRRRISQWRSELLMSIGLGHNEAPMRAPAAVPVRIRPARGARNPRHADHVDYLNAQVVRHAPLLIAVAGAMICLLRISATLP